MYNVPELREKEFPLSKNVLYFNHASISPLPARTQERMKWATDKLAEHPMQHFFNDGLKLFQDYPALMARHINAAHPHEVVYIPSTSFGINSVAQAIQWKEGDNLLFCDTEFPANAYPWMSLERDGVEVRQVPSSNGGLTLDTLLPYVDKNTKLIAVSAIQFFSGHRTDLEKMGAFCRERGIIFSVDAIQAAGHIPIDVQAMNIDILAAGGQKSLIGPIGTGFLYVRDEICQTMHPRFIGANATQDYLWWLNYDLTPLDGAARFSNGTVNTVGMFGLMESVTLLNELGMENIDHYTTGLAAEAIELLASSGYELATIREEHGPIVTFKSKFDDPQTDEMLKWLTEQNVSLVKHWDKNRVPHLRLSFHCYNTREEIHQFIEMIRGYTPQ